MNVVSKYRTTPDTKELIKQITNHIRRIDNSSSTYSAFDELKKIIRFNAKKPEVLNTIIEIFTEQSERMTKYKEALKVFNIMGEVLNANLILVLPKIVTHFKKRCEDSQYHVAISDSLGIMCYHLFRGAGSIEDKTVQLSSLTNQLLNYLKHSSKNVQIGIAMCLNKLIKNSPLRAVTGILSSVIADIIKLIQNPTTKCTLQLYEVIITLIVSIKLNFEPYVFNLFPILINSIKNHKESIIRKAAINVIYVLLSFLPLSLKSHKKKLISILEERKNDKAKEVKDAASETLEKLELCFNEESLERAVKEEPLNTCKGSYFCLNIL